MQVSQFDKFVNIYLQALDIIVRELCNQLPGTSPTSSAIKQAFTVLHRSRQVLESSVKATDTNPQVKSYRVYDAARAVWRYFSELLEDVARIQGHGNNQQPSVTSPVIYDDDDEVSKEIQEVASIFKTAMNSSVASIKFAKHSIGEYFQKFTLTRKLVWPLAGTASQGTAASGTAASSSTSTLVSGRNLPRSSATCSDPPHHRYGLRESHIFFSAANSFVATLPPPQLGSSAGPLVPPFLWAWWASLPEDQGVFVKINVEGCDGKVVEKEVFAGGSFQYVVRHVLENIDNPASTDLNDAFFMYFRKHESSMVLFELLRKWYTAPSPAARTFAEAEQLAFRRYVKTQVIKMLTRWMENYWLDTEDHALREKLIKFTHDIVAEDRDLACDIASLLSVSLCRIAKARVTQYQKRFQAQIDKAQKDQQNYTPTAFTSQLKHMTDMKKRGKDIKLIEPLVFKQKGGAEELARALTLLESDIFHRILPETIASWRNDAVKSDAMEFWTVFINTLTFFVVDFVIRHEDETDRVAAYETMIDVAVVSDPDLSSNA